MQSVDQLLKKVYRETIVPFFEKLTKIFKKEKKKLSRRSKATWVEHQRPRDETGVRPTNVQRNVHSANVCISQKTSWHVSPTRRLRATAHIVSMFPENLPRSIDRSPTELPLSLNPNRRNPSPIILPLLSIIFIIDTSKFDDRTGTKRTSERVVSLIEMCTLLEPRTTTEQQFEKSKNHYTRLRHLDAITCQR